MTVSIETSEDCVKIEEGNETVILLEETENGILLSVRGTITDRKAGDAVSVVNPVDFVSFGNESFESELQDSLESLLLNETSGSYLMQKGSVSQEAINQLQSGFNKEADENEVGEDS